jgi:tetratricopeptide (TPR) repeat protein
MEKDNNFDKIKCFELFADNNLDIWKELIGQNVMQNSKYKKGSIQDVIPMGLGEFKLIIRFVELPTETELKSFTYKAFIAGQLEMLDPDLFEIKGFLEYYNHKKNEEKRKAEINEKRRKQKLLEEMVLKEFNDLKIKNGLQYSEHGTDTPLFKVLSNMEALKEQDKNSMLWLRDNIPALYFELEYSKTNNLKLLTKACSEWRKAKQPRRVIQLLQSKTTTDNKTMSTILTVLAATYNDINEFEKAELYCHEAIKKDICSPYPLNVMGAIYSKKGMPVQGEVYFKRALKLNSKDYDEYSSEEFIQIEN